MAPQLPQCTLGWKLTPNPSRLLCGGFWYMLSLRKTVDKQHRKVHLKGTFVWRIPREDDKRSIFIIIIGENHDNQYFFTYMPDAEIK